MHAGIPPWADTPRADTPRKQTATAADGTHPTGMHSLHIFILVNIILLLQARHLCFFFDYAALSLYSLGVAIAYKAYLFPRELIGTRSVQLIIRESQPHIH